METFDFTGGSPEEKIKFFFEDYMSKFYELLYTLEGKGIGAVQDIMKDGHKVMTAEEYVGSNHSTIPKEDPNSLIGNPAFQAKAVKLNKLAQDLNNLAEDIDEDTLKTIVGEAEEIVYSK